MTHGDYFWVVKKIPVINLHVVVMPLNEPTISIYFFPSHFTITDLSDSQKIECKCFWLVYSSYHLLNLSFSQSDRLNYPFLSSKKTRNEKFQNRKDIPLLPPLSHLFNFPLPLKTPPPPPPPQREFVLGNCPEIQSKTKQKR